MGEIVFGAPIEIQEFTSEIMFLASALENPLSLGDDFLAYTVAGDHCDI